MMQLYLSKQNTVCKNFSLQAKNIKPLTAIREKTAVFITVDMLQY